jgi:predicted AlkP superfamily phosphohydrolase/phosphomutase
MASSRDPGELGIYGFRNRKDFTYRGLVTADARWVTVDRIWDILGRLGKHVVVLGVPQTYPPLPVSGELISCFLTPDTRTHDYTYPVSLKSEIELLLGGPYAVDVQDYRSDDRDRILDQIYAMTEQRFAVARHLLATRPWDFLMMHEIGLDRIQHAFWRYMDPTHRDHQPGHRFGSAIHDYYVYLDRQIGQLLESFDDRTTVLIVSDHGAQKMEGAVRVNDWLIREGFMTLREAVEGEVPFAHAPIDWAGTRVWGEGGHYCRLCLNVQGREQYGIVTTAEYEPLRTELIERLEALPGPDGQPLGTRVYRPESLWPTRQGIAPDLVVYFGDLAWRSNGSIGSDSIYSFDNDTGPDDANHTRHGIFIMAGPHMLPERRDEVPIYDVAPTVLDLLGVPIPAAMRGRPIARRAPDAPPHQVS